MGNLSKALGGYTETPWGWVDNSDYERNYERDGEISLRRKCGRANLNGLVLLKMGIVEKDRYNNIPYYWKITQEEIDTMLDGLVDEFLNDTWRKLLPKRAHHDDDVIALACKHFDIEDWLRSQYWPDDKWPFEKQCENLDMLGDAWAAVHDVEIDRLMEAASDWTWKEKYELRQVRRDCWVRNTREDSYDNFYNLYNQIVEKRNAPPPPPVVEEEVVVEEVITVEEGVAEPEPPKRGPRFVEDHERLGDNPFAALAALKGKL